MNFPTTTRARIETLRKLCRDHHDAVVPFGGGTALCLCGTEKGGMTVSCIALDDLLKIAEEAQWRPIRRFPETLDEAAAWGYRVPMTGEEVEAEQPIQFEGYPALGEVQTITQDDYSATFAQSEIVETLSREGFAISARWVWVKRATGAYRWDAAPNRQNIHPRAVDFWRPLIMPDAAP